MELKEASDSKDLKINLGKTKVMVRGGFTNDGLSRCIVDPCGVCSLRLKANSVLCVLCEKWFHSRCARVKRVTAKLSRHPTSKKMKMV